MDGVESESKKVRERDRVAVVDSKEKNAAKPASRMAMGARGSRGRWPVSVVQP